MKSRPYITVEVHAGFFNSERILSFDVEDKGHEMFIDIRDTRLDGNKLYVGLESHPFTGEPLEDTQGRYLVYLPMSLAMGGDRLFMPKDMIQWDSMQGSKSVWQISLPD